MDALLSAALPDSSDNGILVSFQAGKMTKEGRMVTADPRRGTLSLIVSADDTLTHLQWRARGTSEPEEDLIIFANEVEFVRVDVDCPLNDPLVKSASVY
jgi:hypothetical protein